MSSAQKWRALVAAYFQRFAVINQANAHAVGVAAFGVEDLAAVPRQGLVFFDLDIAEDHHARDGLIFSFIGAGCAPDIGLGWVENAVNRAHQAIFGFDNFDDGCCGTGVLVNRGPGAPRDGLGQRASRENRQGGQDQIGLDLSHGGRTESSMPALCT